MVLIKMQCPYCKSENTIDLNLDEGEYTMIYWYRCRDCSKDFYAVFNFECYTNEDGDVI
jgi:transposase-like protein